ncbi:AGE family epimerase/isomerase [Leptolyngbya cf. ectocarpi LEGE 11479]|uniref:AGE family epimerase/isomerase n=1 Tax=Leptolyngbya cf. ectocarpi LEGE 11479 TaxID=1828722 RepID=A0A928X3E0_LEPEC|nr:AGE family epimerase/isomerase [Leptolyngbya ectocarpi]MBE9066616.1 AGE family epimerase/isomerase [Leptolyngbya cf. ectocarpi LEGE 11479]
MNQPFVWHSNIRAFALALPLGLLPFDGIPATTSLKSFQPLYSTSVLAATVPKDGTSNTAQAATALPTGQQWLDHVQQDLLPFWTSPTALGNPIGNFPSVRCDDGTLVNPDNPCPEIQGEDDWLLKNDQYVVALSRQIYTYGVAFQLTGNRQYLDYAKAGVDYFRQHALDREAGGAYSWWSAESESWEPALDYRNAQEQAYALMGIGYYYYLTRDPEILPDILALKEYIFNTYYNPELGLLQWQLQDGEWGNALDQSLTAQLDQLNAYMMLLTPILPEAEQTEWTQDLLMLSEIMLSRFYSPEENLFLLSPHTPKLPPETDFGHTIKTMWFLRMIGLLSDEQSLVDFSMNNGPRVLERAYLAEPGTWASSVFSNGTINEERSWWVHSELDQFTASLALADPTLTAYLTETYDYWFNYFVDPQFGEVWNNISASTDQPIQDFPKQWPWKNGYHSFEHALVGYITSSQLHEQPTVLYYAFEQMPDLDTIHPYYYQGKINEIVLFPQPDASIIYRVNFSEIQ